MDGNADEILTIQELSDYLKVPVSTLYKLVREGAIPSFKVGKHWRFHMAAIDRWIAKSGDESQTEQRDEIADSS